MTHLLQKCLKTKIYSQAISKWWGMLLNYYNKTCLVLFACVWHRYSAWCCYTQKNKTKDEENDGGDVIKLKWKTAKENLFGTEIKKFFSNCGYGALLLKWNCFVPELTSRFVLNFPSFFSIVRLDVNLSWNDKRLTNVEKMFKVKENLHSCPDFCISILIRWQTRTTVILT